ncbi:MAG: LON peptidase substrate-binding domain-containing protein [Gammaproteobacteria bacterium]|jgi:Lon protease-like protein
MDPTVTELPLFPLGTVLFQGGNLQLQLFEPRYLDMVSRCMREGSAFGVVLIRRGSDTWRAGVPGPELFDIGTEARIVDFNQLGNGRLGISVRGSRKFRVRATREQEDHLLIGKVTYLPEEPVMAVGREHQDLVDLLRELLTHPGVQKLNLDIDLNDARSVGWRLSELLPIEAEIKQSLLKLQLPRERLQELTRLVNKLRG